MTPRRLAVLCCIFTFAVSTYAQGTKDPQAISVLTESLNAMGGLTAVSSIQDYTGTGTVAYYWADQTVQGSVTVRGMGLGNFRLDANLPDGTRTWAVCAYSGVLIHQDGSRESTAFYNLMTAGSMTLPIIRFAAALNNPATTLTLVGTVTANNPGGYQIHVVPPNASTIPGSSSMSGLGSFDVFVDSTSLLPTKLTEQVRLESNPTVTLLHEIGFQNFSTIGNIKAPMTINESLNAQLASTITLSAMTFNNGLTQADFTP